jgi:hypothetical protein
MEIKWKNTNSETTFSSLIVGDIFVANDYEDRCLFMKIKKDASLRSDRDLGTIWMALDLSDGLAIHMQELQPVKRVNAHVVVE